MLLLGVGAISADEAALRAALGDYASGLAQRGHDRLKAYLATNPPDEEVVKVVAKTPKATFEKIARLGGEHKELADALLARGRLKERVQAALDLSLRWLAAHQAPHGLWEADSFGRWCDGVEGDFPADMGVPGRVQYTLGLTALSTLAFLEAGYSPKEAHPYGPVIERSLGALRVAQDAEGCMGPRQSGHYLYGHAAATLALVQAYARTLDADLAEPTRRGLAYLELAQNPGSGWRYGVKPGDSDSSLTAWIALAFEAAARANEADAKASRPASLPFGPGVAAGIRAWFVRSTDARTGEGGYIEKGSGSARPAEYVDAFPAEKTESVTAAGLCARVFLGEDPEKNQTMKMQVARCLARPPVWNPHDGSLDFYYWRYGTHALRGIGGDAWRSWRSALVSAVVPHQRLDGDVCGVKG
jgi:hypothetical protein